MGLTANAVPTLDRQLEAVAHVERRRLLVALLEADRRGEVPLSLEVADPDVYDLELLVAMQHVHLPKLAEPGFVEWDRGTDRVADGPNFDELRPFLRLVQEHYGEVPHEWL